MRAVALALCCGLGACAAMPPAAPAPAKTVNAAQFFTGRWYEIARTPSRFTTNCMAGTTDFLSSAGGQLIERDECHKGTPTGPIRTFQGAVRILTPANNEFTTRYIVFGILPVPRTYWVLDHAPDYAWFIAANPGFTDLDILARVPRSPPSVVASLTAKAKSMGFDTSKLEYPPTGP